MVPLVLALVGLPVGLALDALIERLAVPPNDGPNTHPAPKRALVHNESGSVALGAHGGARSMPMRTLAIVSVTAGLFAIAGARYAEPWQLAIVAAYVCVLIACAATDTLAYRVPNAVTYPAMLAALVIGLAAPDATPADVVLGGLLASAVLFVPSLLTKGAGMGMGDVKLATFAGLALGLSNVMAALLVMALAGGAAATLLLLTGARKRGEPMPYAPFISAGALLALLWQGCAFASLN